VEARKVFTLTTILIPCIILKFKYIVGSTGCQRWQIYGKNGGGGFVRYPDGSSCGTRRLTHLIATPPIAHIDQKKTINLTPIKLSAVDETGLLRMRPWNSDIRIEKFSIFF
jgi:hypothetical protein